MFKILQKTLATGISTVPYPDAAPVISDHFRGRPQFDFAKWIDARQAAEACPTRAIALEDQDDLRHVTIDYGLCVFCGQCAEASPEAVTITRQFDMATRLRRNLVIEAEYSLEADGTHHSLLGALVETAGTDFPDAVHKILGRSLAIRQVDAGSCNGCELEIGALNNPIHDIERLGIHFVASPRHADLLLVTGPVTRNMELALQKTYAATPDPKVVVAVGACGISGGIFGTNYATRGGVDSVVPVDVYVPGCPPRPEALLFGILLATGRLAEKS
jgi:Ni,Fe-hydrogenase III small subunit/ferredoxin